MPQIWKIIGLAGLGAAILLAITISAASAQKVPANAAKTGAAAASSQQQQNSGLPATSGLGNMELGKKSLPLVKHYEIKTAPVVVADPVAVEAAKPAVVAKPVKPAKCVYRDENGVEHKVPCRE